MRLLKLASLLLCAICFNVRGDAQSPGIAEKPVWTLEFIEVGPDMGLTLGYLDDHWIPGRALATFRGCVCLSSRIVRQRHKSFHPFHGKDVEESRRWAFIERARNSLLVYTPPLLRENAHPISLGHWNSCSSCVPLQWRASANFVHQTEAGPQIG